MRLLQGGQVFLRALICNGDFACRLRLMNGIASAGVAALALLVTLKTPAHIFVLDDFETGDFAIGGPQSFSQTLPEEHVLGGVRQVTLTMDGAAVRDGMLTMIRTDNSILQLNYGSFGDANAAEHLHFDAGAAGEATMDVEIPYVLRDPLTVYGRFYSFTIENGVPQHHYSSATFGFYSWEPKRESIALRDFIGDADFRDIAGFQIQLGEIDFTRAELNVSGVTLTAVPEPQAYAMAVGLALCLWAGIRRRFA
jgi:hypothetical protein